ncbi:cupin domain-containing protein [Pectobacterium zantedeschiae]|uniref:Cupin domain-containing protein n=1 Tax=Pectobacterium zantedeschiae TaxID=2034769 RepID=A0A9X8JLQ0_9GAMM|nr:cupin domain-containing protein [Pectobacterium zantedeschiae]RYC42488.1 cupin domain-containing protein [Pectobacterium zantedeschiae]RYC45726.1 cupin domain-containing protein [Pectobacterium zantedeschiae]RYC47234.1 cupin domain-containing protein [Pectobacterium zantedeschiae]
MISKDNAEHYVWGDSCDGWYLVKRQDMSIIHERMPSGAKEKRHYHSESRQFFFVLAGTLTIELEGEAHIITEHQGLEIPPSTKHQAKNESDDNVDFIVVSHPTTRGDRIDLL